MTENGSRGARRCLFGREDPERLSRDLAEQVRHEERSSAEDFEKRWNFRIRNETPLSGRYQWEKIDDTLSATSSGRGLSSFPSSPIVDKAVNKAVDQSSENEKSSAKEKSIESSLSSLTSKSDATEASPSSEEKDVNQNVVREPTKRKAPVLPIKDTKEVKRAKPP